jgi:hypothetical protein
MVEIKKGTWVKISKLSNEITDNVNSMIDLIIEISECPWQIKCNIRKICKNKRITTLGGLKEVCPYVWTNLFKNEKI